MGNVDDLVIEGREEMSLLGLMLGGILERNLETAKGQALAKKLSGTIGVTGGKMKVTLRFDRGKVTVARGHDAKLTSRVKGTLDGLLQVSLGRGAVRSFMSGDVSFSGNPFFLLKMLPLMRVPQGDSQ